MVPVRHCPVSEWAIGAYVTRYAAAMDIDVGVVALRAALPFSFITSSNASGKPHCHLRLCIKGGWCPTGSMCETTYLHQGYVAAALAHMVRLPIHIRFVCNTHV